MRARDIHALFDFTYWANRQVLDAVAALPVADFIRPTTITYRNLRGTLVHSPATPIGSRSGTTSSTS